SSSEEVRILVHGPRVEREARDVLSKLPLNEDRISFWRVPTDRVWTRDYGPLFVRSDKPQPAMVNWAFNGWAKYPNHKRDNDVCRNLGCRLLVRTLWPEVGGRRVVLEGGSIDVNGQGLLLTTEECLLSPVQERNPGIDRAQLEKTFADYLGVRKVLWLGQGIAGDDTHGHVDDLARFVAPRKVVAVVEANPQ